MAIKEFKKEFKERTGFEPSDEYFNNVIIPNYINSDYDRKEFCELWKKENGIQTAYDYQCSNNIKLCNENIALRAELAEVRYILRLRCSELEHYSKESKKYQSIVQSIIEQSLKLDIKDIIINVIKNI